MSKCHSSLFVALPLPPYVRALFQKIPGEMRAHKFRPIRNVSFLSKLHDSREQASCLNVHRHISSGLTQVRQFMWKTAESGKPKACMLHTRLRNFATPGFLGCGPVILTPQHGFQHIQFYTQTTAGSRCFLGLESESMFVLLCPARDRNLKD